MQLKSEPFLLGLMDSQLGKKSHGTFFIYDNCSEITTCSKVERFDLTHKRILVGGDDGNCRDGYGLHRIIELYGTVEVFYSNSFSREGILILSQITFV